MAATAALSTSPRRLTSWASTTMVRCHMRLTLGAPCRGAPCICDPCTAALGAAKAWGCRRFTLPAATLHLASLCAPPPHPLPLCPCICLLLRALNKQPPPFTLHLSAAAETTQTANANGGNGGAGINGRKMLVHTQKQNHVHRTRKRPVHQAQCAQRLTCVPCIRHKTPT